MNNIVTSLKSAGNQFNTKAVGGGSSVLSAAKGAYLNAGDDTSKVAENDIDSFTERLANAFKTDNADVIRALDGLSEADKADIAARSYLQMQGRIISARNKEEQDIKDFRELEEEKYRYKDMLEEAKENGGCAKVKGDKDKRWLFGDREEGSTVTSKEIEDALDDVQSRIDRFLAPYGRNEDGSAISDPDNEVVTRDYIAYAAVFEEMTGLKTPDPGDSLLLHKLDRDESNFVERAQDNINKLNKLSNDLNAQWKKYKDALKGKVGVGDLSEEARARLEAFEFIREKFASGTGTVTVSTLGLLDAQA
ncbi:MAG: hypothetical protein IJT87_04645 [Ruminiclostridium sp.]|nr:hypothetical protein [Ruminiclostridium sp.]